MRENKRLEQLEDAVMRLSPDEVSELMAASGDWVFTARALGMACRFRGLDMVRALVEGGAGFKYDYDEVKSVLGKSFCASITQRGNFHAALLGKAVTIDVYYIEQSNKNGNYGRTVLPLAERLAILDYLIGNAERTGFDADDLLYFSYILNERKFVSALKGAGAVLSEYRISVLTEGKGGDEWLNVAYFMKELSDKELIPVLTGLISEIAAVCGEQKKLHLTETMWQVNRERFQKPEFFRFLLEHYDVSAMNKGKRMKEFILADNVPCLEIAAEFGWLGAPKKRDEIISFAAANKKAECTAFLLEFKNRTADLAAERAKAEKRQMRELAESPDSLSALKRQWSFKKLVDGTLEITSYKGGSTAVTVPVSIGGDTVTVIGEFAFSPRAKRLSDERRGFRKTITAVKLPESVREIRQSAFQECSALENINIPNGVTAIGFNAFFECAKLKRITLPNSIRELGEGVFCGCAELEEINLPHGIEVIPVSCLNRCEKLKTIDIPNTVKKIGKNAFCRCESLKTVRIPNGVTELSGNMFNGCRSLERVELPDTVEHIGFYAFFGCNLLKELVIPGSVKKIENAAFQSCSDLETIALPNGIEEITGGIFTGCVSLKSVKIPDSVKKIGNRVFSGCRSLKSLVIPEGVTEIEHLAFQDCPSLERVELPSSLEDAVNCTSKGFPLRSGLNSADGIVLTIFDKSPNVTAVVPRGSYAESYCKRSGIPFVYK